jgi:hypothetical protein
MGSKGRGQMIIDFADLDILKACWPACAPDFSCGPLYVVLHKLVRKLSGSNLVQSGGNVSKSVSFVHQMLCCGAACLT